MIDKSFLKQLQNQNEDYSQMVQTCQKISWIATQLYHIRISAIKKLETGTNQKQVEDEFFSESENIRKEYLNNNNKGITIRNGNND